ncbi:MAG: class I SAM-dependent methyltransferase [Nannocystaceae bacterium]
MALAPRLEASDASWQVITPAQAAVRDRVRERLRDGTYGTEEVGCFCGEPGGIKIADRDRYGLPVCTLLCMRCGLLRSSPRMTAASTERFYREDYRDLYKATAPDAAALFQNEQIRGWSLTRVLDRLLPHVHTVFELGCGAGGGLLPFAELGKSVAGADLGAEYLEEGRRYGLKLVHGSASALRAECGRADLVFMLHVFEHLLDLREALSEIRQLIAPGGWLFIEVPGLRTIETSYDHDLLLYLQNAHTYHFTEATMRFVLETCGFNVHYCDEDVLALAVLGEATSAAAPVPHGEAHAVVQYLGRLELEFARRHAA